MLIRRALPFVLLVVASFLTSAASAQPPTGTGAAALRLADIVGGGSWTMVNVWSPGCSHCVRELPALVNFHANNDAGARVFGLAVAYPGFGAADPVALEQFGAEHGINFPNHASDGASVSALLGETVDLVPVTYAYDPSGRLVARWHGVVTERDLMEIIADFTPVPR